MLKKITAISLLFLSHYAFAQKNITDSIISIPLIETSLSLQTPSGDMADRFGNNQAINFSFHYKTKKNFTYGLQIQNLTGSNIKNSDNFFGDIETAFGPITSDGQIAEINLQQRGMNTSLQFGKIFKGFGPNPNSGIWLQIGAGYAWNKVKIIDNGNLVAAFNDEFIKGYDQLTEGFLLNQSIGYIYLSNKRLLNFGVSFEIMEAFTTNVREYSYKNMTKVSQNNTDILYGLKLSWFLPLYKKTDNTYHYY